jgi:hypothetical protein
LRYSGLKPIDIPQTSMNMWRNDTHKPTRTQYRPTFIRIMYPANGLKSR